MLKGNKWMKDYSSLSVLQKLNMTCDQGWLLGCATCAVSQLKRTLHLAGLLSLSWISFIIFEEKNSRFHFCSGPHKWCSWLLSRGLIRAPIPIQLLTIIKTHFFPYVQLTIRINRKLKVSSHVLACTRMCWWSLLLTLIKIGWLSWRESRVGLTEILFPPRV